MYVLRKLGVGRYSAVANDSGSINMQVNLNRRETCGPIAGRGDQLGCEDRLIVVCTVNVGAAYRDVTGMHANRT